jgi:ElaB/YqjD/DUF883 family membrane-anchored ribosome-binding protein
MDKIEEIKERYGAEANETAARAEAQWNEFSERARVKSREIWEDTTELIRENPGTAVGVALVAGVVVGSVLVAALKSESSIREDLEAAADLGLKGKRVAAAKETLSETLENLRGLIDHAIAKIQ